MSATTKLQWCPSEPGARPGSRIWVTRDWQWKIVRTDAPRETPDYDVYQHNVYLCSWPSLEIAKSEIAMMAGVS